MITERERHVVPEDRRVCEGWDAGCALGMGVEAREYEEETGVELYQERGPEAGTVMRLGSRMSLVNTSTIAVSGTMPPVIARAERVNPTAFVTELVLRCATTRNPTRPREGTSPVTSATASGRRTTTGLAIEHSSRTSKKGGNEWRPGWKQPGWRPPEILKRPSQSKYPPLPRKAFDSNRSPTASISNGHRDEGSRGRRRSGRAPPASSR